MRYTLLFLILLPAAFAYTFDETLYDAQQVTVELSVESDIILSGSGSGETLQATVYYVPEEAGTLTATPKPATTNPLLFTWNNPRAGTYPFSYTTTVRTEAQRPTITTSIAYPYATPSSVTQYLQAQEITNTNAAIKAKARELSQGKNDSMEVVFAIAQWVEQNVEYNLTTVTEQASKPSSWVLENKYGVCDELTSLFISLSREAGIPARFVSGIAYTNLEQYQDHWGPHGWAEVWLPEVGWVPVDVTYRQVGYLDATHITITRSIDARNTAVDYSLRSRGLTMRAAELQTSTHVLDKQGDISEPLSIKANPLYRETGSKSGNIITATITNNAEYYIATDVYLATTTDTTVYDKRNQEVLLPPKATRQVSWRVAMGEFEAQYEYTIPFTAITSRAGNATTTVRGNAHYKRYALAQPIQTVSSIVVECEQPPVLYTGESTTVHCISPHAQLCENTCSTDTLTITYHAQEPGAYPHTVRATQGQYTGSAVVTFVVEEKPKPAIVATINPQVTPKDSPTLTIQVETAAITNATVRVEAHKLHHKWQVDSLTSKSFELRFAATYLDAGNNTLTISVDGLDKNGAPVHTQTPVQIHQEASMLERIQLFFTHLFL